jgi:glutamine synthetase
MEANIEKIFGENVFNDETMKSRLPKNVYKSLRKTIAESSKLNLDNASVIANAMREWAVEKGATHYTHWFQPMTGATAEKHDSFIEPQADGKVIMSFSGSALIQGEPDASSFPSGGIRATFEARGYTAWDPSSPAFIREGRNGKTLCIPTAFYSYTGEALDKKTPLLRSMNALSKAAVRLLNLIGENDVTHVTATVGAEQEYFLIDKHFFYLRPDLMTCGRSLFGAQPARGQQLEDHYFGSIKPRVLAFMQELENELYKLGIPVKTRHNEVAPAQYEIAAVYEAANLATDHNMLTMELLSQVAHRNDMVCLMHEKPFAGINGNGKHNNWSLADNLGNNLLEPGDTPHENAKFLLFLTAVIKAIDVHNDLLRASVAKAGNDHRLGANEAPPAIISTFLGEQLTQIVEKFAQGKKMAGKETSNLNIGITSLPPLPRHNTDRNRTSPFAFTGNKFEYRAVGSSQNIALPNMVLNTIVADSLDTLSDELENQLGDKEDLNKAIENVITNNLKKHQRVIFNGDNYSKEWEKEAAKRGLGNLKSTVEAIDVFSTEESIELFNRYKVLSPKESESRVAVRFDQYVKLLDIETSMTLSLGRTKILPAALKYQKTLADTINGTQKADVKIQQTSSRKFLQKLVRQINLFDETLENLEKKHQATRNMEDNRLAAQNYRNEVIPAMDRVRENGDILEEILDDESWPLPKYNEILFVH